MSKYYLTKWHKSDRASGYRIYKAFGLVLYLRSKFSKLPINFQAVVDNLLYFVLTEFTDPL